MNILITGSSGFIGTNLIKHLSQCNNYHIFECDRKIGFQCLDINDEYIKKNNITCIVHLAAQTSVWNNDIMQIEEDNIKSFIHVFLLAKKHDIKFIYSSSSCSINMTSMYGLSKHFNDEFVKLYDYKKCMCLRFHNVYGKDSRKDTLCGICLENDEIVLYNNGKNVRHFTHINDVCKCIKIAIDTIDNGNFNVLNEEENTTLEFCNEIAKYKKLKITLIPNIREFDKNYQCIDKSYSNLNNNFLTINEGIRKIFEK